MEVTPALPVSSPSHRGAQVTLAVFVLIPLLAVAAAIPIAWGWGLRPRDLVITAVFYMLTGFGITVGFHRHFTHGSFRATRPLRIALAIMGSLAVEGSPIQWVADHRKHHKYSDREGDPHTPWGHGNSVGGLLRGLFHAHLGWLFKVGQSPPARYAPDLLADADLVRVSRHFPTIVAVSILLPPLVGGLWSWSWWGAASGFFWAVLVRIALLHHVTWSINSICHVAGSHPFRSRDRSGNVWWLALASFGESWHNLHHAEPTCARHGVLRGQVDTSARLIWLFEKLGWASRKSGGAIQRRCSLVLGNAIRRTSEPKLTVTSAVPTTAVTVPTP
jgi:stearoyl-CoA desaturase (delta-9 desaturase)